MGSIRLAAVTCIAAAIAGCAAPGTPLVRTTENDGEGRLIDGCNNISRKVRVDNYIKDYYLTTWGSALAEGAMEGVSRGTEDAGRSASGVVVKEAVEVVSGRKNAAARVQSAPESKWREKKNSLSSSPVPFCRRYPAKFSEVYGAVVSTIGDLEHRIILRDKQLGILETDFVERRHSAARWRDRYVIFVDPDEPDQSVVRVFRIVYIDRSGTMFNQATSVGHNEAWILTRVGDQLERNKKSFTPK